MSLLGSIFGTDVKAPAPRDPVAEGRNMFKAQKELAPGIFEQVGQYAPQMAEIGAANAAAISASSREQNPLLYGLLDMQGQQATDQLARGGYLGPDEVRQIQQDSRAGWNDRGLVRSEPSAFDEVLNLYGARRNRLNQDQSYAANVTSLLGNERNFAYNAGSNNTAGLLTMFDPFNQYGQDLANTNYNGEASAKIATANNNAAMVSGAMMMGGLAMCWIAREVYGANDPSWRMFRNWLLERAPRWFRGLYIAYGPDFARWIANKPRLKAVIRHWMDARIGAQRSTDIPEIYKDYVEEV